MQRWILLCVLSLPLSCANLSESDGNLPELHGQDPALSFDQALGGALNANPEIYSNIPIRLSASTNLQSLAIELDGQRWTAENLGQQKWLANVHIGNLSDDSYAMQAVGLAKSGEIISHVDLVISRNGIQLSNFNEVGFSGTPRMHRRGKDLWLTWTDRAQDQAEAWLQQIDGAGRFLGERVALVNADVETIYARTAFGDNTIGILYQQAGGPYRNYFKVVDFDGKEIVPAMALEEPGDQGSYGGDIKFSNGHYFVIWRSNNGPEDSSISWMKFAAETLTKIGPLKITSAGPGTAAQPDGTFLPISKMSLAVHDETSLVSFVRSYWHPWLAMKIDKAQVVTLSATGNIEEEIYNGGTIPLTYAHEGRIFHDGDNFVSLWSEVDLNAPQDSSDQTLFKAERYSKYGRRTNDLAGPSTLLQAPGHRAEPYLVNRPEHTNILLWTDNRSAQEDLLEGRIELFAAPLSQQFNLGEEVIVPHARFIEGTSHLQGQAQGSNVLLTWIDERHGMGIIDSKPELWLETLWF
ncbi:MAG: hypothetical protein QGI45_05750 [Myxococcota bacterium]|jgi:hypothetical protein|nr:hypothetical protein [Myxococcota bacterium]